MKTNEERDWSELLPDVLNLISKKLPDLCDFVRFRAVCKSWCFAVPISDPPPQFPWILMHDPSPDNELCFYSLSCGKVHRIHAPEARGRMLIGPAQNYIFAIDREGSSPSLLNLLTKNEVPLPPIKNFHGRSSICMAPSCKPTQEGEHVVIWQWNKWDSRICTLGLWQPGNEKWTEIEKYSNWAMQFYNDGMYYVYNKRTSETEVIDVRAGTGAPTILVPPPETEFNYFVMSEEGLLGIHCYPGWPCEIYHLVQGNHANPHWMKLKTIGDQMIFLSGRHTGFSAKVSNMNQFKGNCVYLLINHRDLSFSLDVYGIDAGKWEIWPISPDDADFDRALTWFMPKI
ncbi:F-box family protein [Rhynchospora pubera]|uniref:F-box family protein n=1 Tax=Rhynchospora pubera TaxID=906938 RepID=A0AAV8C4F9_9POAL|nr:F-box family protein [Rhynchospora pubera]